MIFEIVQIDDNKIRRWRQNRISLIEVISHLFFQLKLKLLQQQFLEKYKFLMKKIQFFPLM